MTTAITKVTIQHNKYTNSYTVWTTYQNRGQEPYQGFNPYPTLEEATEEAESIISRCDSDFRSVVDSYEIK